MVTIFMMNEEIARGMVCFFHQKKHSYLIFIRCRPGLPDFYWCNIPNREEMYQMDTKYTKSPQSIPNDHNMGWDRVARFLLVQHTKTGRNVPNGNKTYQMDIKYTKWP
jgi:hypothetical protein